MSVIYILLPLASLLAAGGVAAFIWAVRRGQFDDLDTPAVRMLHDDEDEGGIGRADFPYGLSAAIAIAADSWYPGTAYFAWEDDYS